MSQQQVPENAIEGLLSQLDASKQLFNESLNSVFQFRTQCIHLQKENQKLANQVNQLKAELEKLREPQASDVAPDPAL